MVEKMLRKGDAAIEFKVLLQVNEVQAFVLGQDWVLQIGDHAFLVYGHPCSLEEILDMQPPIPRDHPALKGITNMVLIPKGHGMWWRFSN